MKYNIRKISSDAARLTLESTCSLDPHRNPEISRFISRNGFLFKSKGAVLGRNNRESCALILHVRPHDIICVKERLRGCVDYLWHYFRIAADYTPVPLDLGERCPSEGKLSDLLEISEIEELDQIDANDLWLRSFFAQRHPTWLQAIVDRQLDHWKQHKPQKFQRLAPTVIENTGYRTPRVSPFTNLSLFRLRLASANRACHATKYPNLAVKNTTEWIPPLEREMYLLDHGHEALLHAAEYLSNEELAVCALINMDTAFSVRVNMRPERRAILLANSFRISFLTDYGGSLPELQDEIRKSIVAFPNHWAASEAGGFPVVLRNLAKFVDMPQDPTLISELLEKSDPKDRKILLDHIVSGI